MNLQQLQQAVQNLFPSAIYGVSYTASVDSSGNATIALWSNTIGTQPTSDQLTAALASAELVAARAQQNALLQAAYETARYSTPVSITSGSATLTFPVDTATQGNIADYITFFASCTATGATPPATVPLQDNAKNVQMLTLAQLQHLAVAIGQQSMNAFNTVVSLMAQVQAAATVAAVQAIVWPAS